MKGSNVAKRDFLTGIIALGDEHPARFLHLIRDGWPEIKAAIDQGHTLKVIHRRLVEGGVRISYRCFTTYVRRFQRRPEELGQATRKAEPIPSAAAPAEKAEHLAPPEPIVTEGSAIGPEPEAERKSGEASTEELFHY
jgi:hypothetical protein